MLQFPDLNLGSPERLRLAETYRLVRAYGLVQDFELRRVYVLVQESRLALESVSRSCSGEWLTKAEKELDGHVQEGVTDFQFVLLPLLMSVECHAVS